jgi:hypothetical protein
MILWTSVMSEVIVLDHVVDGVYEVDYSSGGVDGECVVGRNPKEQSQQYQLQV